MSGWILVPCLVSLRNEFNKLAPSRDKASDGSVGDTSHAAGASDHNPDETGNVGTHDADDVDEVHAIDVDNELRKTGWSMQRAVDIIVGNHRAGRDNRLQNVIYNRRIASASWGWTWRDYTGPSPHTEHAHFSARYTTAQEQDTSPWGLLEAEDGLPMEQSQFNTLMNGWAKSAAGRAAIADAVLDGQTGNEAYPSRRLRDFANDVWAIRDDYVGDARGAAVSPPRPGSLGALIKAVVVDASEPPPAAK